MCVCVYVCEREREIEKETNEPVDDLLLSNFTLFFSFFFLLHYRPE